MKFLITGAAGFLGFALASRLAQDPRNEVICIDNFIRGERDDAYLDLVRRPNVREIAIDLNEQTSVRNLPDEVDIVYHMAALNGTQNFYERPFEVVRCCTLPTIFLLEKYVSCRRIKRFVYAGTSEAYASTVSRFNWPVPTAEDVPLAIDDISNARWSYGGSKMHGEISTINACRSAKIPYSIIRFHNVYGPRMGDKHVVPDFLNRARVGSYVLYGYEDTRSFIYVDDAVSATILVAGSDACIGEIVNIGGTDEITMLELARKIMTICDMKGDITLYPSPTGSVKRRAPDISKLKYLTGYTPQWDLEAGLRVTAEYYLHSHTKV
jgi:nucleoside-diphosphate-sugar epimerase